MQLPDTEDIEFVLCAVEEELILRNKDSDGHGFKRHDGYAEYYNHLYGDVIALCEDEELEEYELSEKDVAKKDLNEEEEEEEEEEKVNKEETNALIVLVVNEDLKE